MHCHDEIQSLHWVQRLGELEPREISSGLTMVPVGRVDGPENEARAPMHRRDMTMTPQKTTHTVGATCPGPRARAVCISYLWAWRRRPRPDDDALLKNNEDEKRAWWLRIKRWARRLFKIGKFEHLLSNDGPGGFAKSEIVSYWRWYEGLTITPNCRLRKGQWQQAIYWEYDITECGCRTIPPVLKMQHFRIVPFCAHGARCVAVPENQHFSLIDCIFTRTARRGFFLHFFLNDLSWGSIRQPCRWW